MAQPIVAASPDTLLMALRVKDAIQAFVQEMLGGEARPDEEPHFIDVREWTRENWRRFLVATPVVGWREHDKGGMLPLLGGPMTKTMEILYPYSPAEGRRGIFTDPVVKLGGAGYWNGATRFMDEREVVLLWAKSLFKLMTEIYESGAPLIEKKD
ncbi:hypothetical protein [Limibacillus halophilus]